MRSSFSSNIPPLFDFTALHPQTARMAVILDRFAFHGVITCVFNDMLLHTTDLKNRSFFDFVSEEWEKDVRNSIEMVKGWGVNDRGQPSDGGFGYGGFALCLQGRDSSYVFV